MKDYNKWLSEDAVQNPINYTEHSSLELVMGNVVTPLDPNSEHWISETPQLSTYLEYAKELKAAVKSGDDTEIQELVKNAKDYGLFRNEQTTIWKRSQIDGVEKFRSDAEYMKWIAGYIINKIDLFKSWCDNSYGKDANKI